MKIAAILLGTLLATGCGARQGGKSPQDVLELYLAALEGDRPEDAYQLLGAEARSRLPRDRFIARWSTLKAERSEQAGLLRRPGSTTLAVGATLEYTAGVRLVWSHARDGWALEGGFPVELIAQSPAEAVRAFLGALERRDLASARKMLSTEARESLGSRAYERLAALADRMGIDTSAPKNRERITLQLVREGNSWRIDRIE